MAQSAQPPSRNSGVSELLEAAAELFRNSLLKCLPLAMFTMLFASLSPLYLELTGQKISIELMREPRFWLLYGFGVCGSLLFSSALIVRLRALRERRLTRLAEDMAAALRRWPVVLASWVIGVVLATAGFLALILPGIYLGVCLLPLGVVAVLEPVGAITAVRRSFVLVRPMWTRTFACAVIAGLVVVVCIFTASLVLGLAAGLLGSADTPATRAVLTAGMLLMQSGATVFLLALCLTIYSAANSSA